jgi:hypothetical protein
MANQAVRATDRGRAPPARPLPQHVPDNGNRYTLAQRVQVLTLWAEGFPPAYIEKKTDVKERSQRNIRKKAIERGFDPATSPRILDSYVVDGAHTGRPKKVSAEAEEGLLANVRNDHSGGDKSGEVAA